MIRDTSRSILYTVAMLGMLGLGFWASPAAAQLAAWQQPPDFNRSDRSDCPHPNPLVEDAETSDRLAPASSGTAGLDSPDHSPAPWSSEDCEQEGDALGFPRGGLSNLICQSVHDRFWLRGEFLGWWTKGFATPPLLTTSPTGTAPAQAGVLGAAGTNVLLGGEDLGGGFRAGERITFGAWLNSCQTLGVEASYLQLNPQTEFFHANGASAPILARPFFNSETGQQASQLIDYPGQQSGTFSSAAGSGFQVVEVLVRKNLDHGPGPAVDLVAGYRYQQLQDHLEVVDALTFSGTQSAFPAGSTVQQTDRFDTRNVFQGGEVGISTSLHRQCWTLDTLLKIAIGQTHSHVDIEGATATTVPGRAATFVPGGLLALPSNIGGHDSDQFSVVPELGVTLGFDLTPQLRAIIGYDLVYWNNVARPGDQIDLNIDPRQLPPATSPTATRPEFILHTSDYWAQGLNLGLDLRF